MKARTWVDHLAFEGGGSVFEKILLACILDSKILPFTHVE